MANAMGAKCDKLKILSLNIRSLRTNFSELELFLQNTGVSFDILALSETWVMKCESYKYFLSGYNLFVQEREEKRSGGVALYIKSNITGSVDEINCSTFNALKFKIKSSDGSVLSGLVVYRFCKSNMGKFLTEYEHEILKIEGRVILVGDLNIDISPASESNSYLNMMSSLGFKSHVNEFTRIRGNSQTCLDHVFYRESSWGVGGPGAVDIRCLTQSVSFSDHKAISVFLSAPGICIKREFVEVRKTNWDAVSKNIATKDWTDIENLSDINHAFSEFVETLKNIIHDATSVRTSRISDNARASWASDRLAALSSEKK